MTSMKCVVSFAVFVIAVLAVQQSSSAQDAQSSQDLTANSGQEVPTGFLPSTNSLSKFTQKRTWNPKTNTGSFNGYSVYRSTPNYGSPGSGGNGFHHYPAPMDRYTNWYRPKAATLTQGERCEPDAFRPRGFGNIFARPCDGFRMDYEPYAIGDTVSTYGPSYMLRAPDPRCKCCGNGDCDHGHKCEQCR